VDLGSVAAVALIAGFAGGAVGAALVGTIEGILRQRQPARGSASYGGGWRSGSTRIYASEQRIRGDAPFDDLSDRAKRVLALAQDEAKRFNHGYIGSEHLLLGLSREGEGVATRALESLGATLPRLRAAAESVIGRGEMTMETIALADTAKSAISKARYEAHKLGHAQIDAEHLLLGLVRAGGIAMGLLRTLEIEPERVVQQVIATLGQPEDTMVSDRLNTESRKVMTLARQEAIQNGHSYIGTEHLALAFRLHKTPMLDRIWSQLAVDPEALRRRIEAAVPPTVGSTIPTRLGTTPRVGSILTMARVLAAKRKREQISPEIFLMALADEGVGVGAQVLASFGATAERIREIVDGPTS
jgi:ATP-dependent Clp protease ATP-binding subunit ClpA